MNRGSPAEHENEAAWGGGAMLSGSDGGGARAVVLAGASQPVSESGPGRCYVPQSVASFTESTQSRLFYSVAALPPPRSAEALPWTSFIVAVQASTSTSRWSSSVSASSLTAALSARRFALSEPRPTPCSPWPTG